MHSMVMVVGGGFNSICSFAVMFKENLIKKTASYKVNEGSKDMSFACEFCVFHIWARVQNRFLSINIKRIKRIEMAFVAGADEKRVQSDRVYRSLNETFKTIFECSMKFQFNMILPNNRKTRISPFSLLNCLEWLHMKACWFRKHFYRLFFFSFNFFSCYNFRLNKNICSPHIKIATNQLKLEMILFSLIYNQSSPKGKKTPSPLRVLR